MFSVNHGFVNDCEYLFQSKFSLKNYTLVEQTPSPATYRRARLFTTIFAAVSFPKSDRGVSCYP